jgi:hypothetical protein
MQFPLVCRPCLALISSSRGVLRFYDFESLYNQLLDATKKGHNR